MSEVDPILIKYEEAVTPLVVAKDKGFRERLPRASHFFCQMFVTDDSRALDVEKNPEDMQQRDLMIKEMQQISSELASRQSDVARINREYLPKVLSKLAPEHAKKVNDAYSMIAWSYVYPDTTDPEELYQRLHDSNALDDPLRALFEQHWTEYRSKYKDLCTRACSLNEDMERQLAATRVSNGNEERRKEIFALMWQRIALDKKFIDTIAALLPPEVADAHKGALYEFSLAIKRARPAHLPLSEPSPFADSAKR